MDVPLVAGLKSSKFPQPKTGHDFEQLCLDLYRRIWDDPGAQLNGRSGQQQEGVDIFGRPAGSLAYQGVQCRNTEVSSKDLGAEVDKADNFVPQLERFIIATTSPNDAALQKIARQLTTARLSEGKCAIDIVGWATIESMLADYPDVVAAHFPELGVRATPVQPNVLLNIEWHRLPGAPRFRVAPRLDGTRFLVQVGLVSGMEPGDLKASWAVNDEAEFFPLLIPLPTRTAGWKATTSQCDWPADTAELVAHLRLRFVTADGEHGYHYWFPLERHEKGHWLLHTHLGSTVHSPEPF